MDTLSSLEICQRLYDRINVFATAAFDHAAADFRALYRNRVQEFPGGFRRIDLVPKALMIRKIIKDCAADPAVALCIFRNWFHAKAELHSTCVASLQSLGYAIAEPDFERDSITHNRLKPEHFRLEDNAYYFSPGNDTSSDKLELTVMAALLGWFPEPSDAVDADK